MHLKEPKVPRFNPAVLPTEYVSPANDVSDDKHPKHYLIPGKVFATREPAAVSAIVGSGIAVCLWDSAAGIGGAANFLLPEDFGGELNMKFGNNANAQLLKDLISLGADACRIQAKIFGGSEPPTTFSSSFGTLGERNVRIALQFLAAEGIRLIDQQTGGTNGRKIVFHTDDGRVWVQKL